MGIAQGSSRAAEERDLSPEQQDFVAAVRRFCAAECSSERLEALTDGFEDLHSDALAARMAELGWYGLTIPEE